jgi:tRNA dimethylallyltransferase
MLEAGLVEENRRLLEAGFRLDANPLRTIGYQEPIAYLEGEIAYEEMVRRLRRNTRRYAKRQLTWFRRRATYEWFDLQSGGWEALLQ